LPERGTAYYHYRCDGPHQARGTVLPCPNRRCHHATALEFHAASLFEKSASYETLLELYDHALEEERNETGDLSRTQEKHAKLSERLAALAAMRERFQRQEAEGLMTLDELRAHLAEIEEEKGRLTVELRTVEDEAAAARRIEAARDSLSGASGYNPVHAEWYEDPDATQPDEVLTLATSPEDIRRTYRRYGARFEVDNEGELTLKLDLALDGGVLSLTSSRT
jgi:DNA repair exonuclease SbcCD ATPase subunit